MTRSAVLDVEPLMAGRMTVKVRVELEDGRQLLVRFYPAGREFVAEFEPELLATLRRLGAKVPQPLAASSQGQNAYLVYEMLPGISLDCLIDRISDPQLVRIALEASEQFMLLAGMPVVGWGDLVSPSRAAKADWRSFVQSVLAEAAGLEALPLLREAATMLATIAEIHQPLPSATLVWTDISPANIIVSHDGDFVGLIDFESVMALEPTAALGYLDARYLNSRFQRCFESVLSTVTSRREVRALYAVVRALRLLPYQGEALPGGGVRDPLCVLLPGLRQACLQLVCRKDAVP